MEQYKYLVEYVLANGEKREDRTGVGTLSVFGTQGRYDLRKGFPLVTLKKTHFSSIVKELLWFLRGETNIKTLDCGIWDQWADKEGGLGPIYGKQWRNWEWRDVDGGMNGYGSCDHNYYSEDQIKELIQNLKSDPMSRRHIVSAWNVGELGEMALQPCHVMFQCYASEIPEKERIRLPGALTQLTREMAPMPSNKQKYREFRFGLPGVSDCSELNETWAHLIEEIEAGRIKLGSTKPFAGWYIHPTTPKYHLDLQLYQRSCDLGLGASFNIASYSLLLMLLARETNMIPRFFIHTIGDCHIYLNHVDALKEMLTREPLPLPSVTIADKPLPYPGCPRDGSVLEPEDFVLENYQHHPFIKLEVAV